MRAAAAEEDVGTAGIAAIGLGLLANPICLWSEYTLKTTGSGLPPGPGTEHLGSVAAPSPSPSEAAAATSPALLSCQPSPHALCLLPLQCTATLQAALWVLPRA